MLWLPENRGREMNKAKRDAQHKHRAKNLKRADKRKVEALAAKKAH